MLPFSDLPYSFFKAKANPILQFCTRLYNRFYVLKNANHKIKRIEISNEHAIQKILNEENASYLLAVNHSTHSDPQVVTEITRRLGVYPYFLTAYEVFLRSRFNRFILPRIGCFSINRDGNDRQALKASCDLLTQAGKMLVIFPEGNVFLTNDRPAPFLEGASFIAMRAQKQIVSKKKPGNIYILPLALKFSHTSDISAKIHEEFEKFAQLVDFKIDKQIGFIKNIRKIGLIFLEKEMLRHGLAHIDDADENALPQALEKSAQKIISKLESELAIANKKSDISLFERIRKIRQKIHKILVAEDCEEKLRTKTEAQSNRALMAYRILAYHGNYISENPSIDRVAEILQNLFEDHNSRFKEPLGERHVYANFAKPINLRERINQKEFKAADLTKEINATITSTIQSINKENKLPGNLVKVA